jgi:hypothetical protein
VCLALGKRLHQDGQDDADRQEGGDDGDDNLDDVIAGAGAGNHGHDQDFDDDKDHDGENYCSESFTHMSYFLFAPRDPRWR